jgi:pimeloyl-ACP methyl ester carboxylesterase
MPALPDQPADSLAHLLGVVEAISDTRHPSTVALLQVGVDPPRFVVCLPGLQDATGSDGASADLPGAVATLTGHSAYIRGVRGLVGSLPPGSQVLLVGHSQGGMVGEAVAEQPHVRGSTIAGLLTAGSPALAQRVTPQVAHLSLRNAEDPVPLLGRAATEGMPLGSDGPVLTFSTPGRWVSGTKHGLGSGGYLATAASDDPKVVRFRTQVSAFLRPGPVPAQFFQVTDR